jgi:transcriptional regulator with XRE-family HTH domain
MATMDLGSRILAWLRVRGITQAQAAKKLGLNASALTHWINGRNPPTQKNLDHLVELLGLTMAEFYGPIPEVPVEVPVETEETAAHAAAVSK